MFFLFINNETFYMKPISIVDDMKQIVVCDMKKNQVDKIMKIQQKKINLTATDPSMEEQENNQKFEMVLLKAQ